MAANEIIVPIEPAASARPAAAAAARPAHLGHGPLQLPLPLLHAARAASTSSYRFLKILRAAVASRKSCAWRGCSCRWACASCASPAASRCCARTSPDLIGDLTSIAGVEDIALTTNGVLLAQHAAELKAAGLQRVTVSLDSLDPDVFARMSGGFGGVDEVLDGIEAAQRAGPRPHQDQRRGPARRQRSHACSHLVERFRGTRRDRALHRVHGRRQPQSTGTPQRVVPSAELLAASMRAGRCAPLEPNYRGEVARRYAFERRRRRSRLHLLGDRSRSAATARARACPPTACSTPACSPHTGSTCASRCAPAPTTRNSRSSSAHVWSGRARTATASCAPTCASAAATRQGRNVLHRRLNMAVQDSRI